MKTVVVKQERRCQVCDSSIPSGSKALTFIIRNERTNKPKRVWACMSHEKSLKALIKEIAESEDMVDIDYEPF